jgi:uncharacterized glyoxalase superfamily protein PhnB
MTPKSGSRSVETNRSVPTDTILPHIIYRNVAEALAWLSTVFGFTEHYRYGLSNGQVQGAQIHLGDAWIMLERARTSSSMQNGPRTHYLTIFVDDVESHYDRARSSGAKIVENLNETVYGERQFVAEDLEGHYWLFSQHVRDVSPEEWGASVSGR